MKDQTVQQLISHYKSILKQCCEHDILAEQEAWWFLEHATGKTQSALLSDDTITLTPEQQKNLDTWVMQRVKEKKPIQYIIGNVPFCNLEILVKPPILIPRPETEEWVSWLIEQLAPVKDEPLQILDLGSGSGCIGLALAKALPQSTVIGLDKNPQAIELAEKNKYHNQKAKHPGRFPGQSCSYPPH